MTDPSSPREIALRLLELGYHPVPIAPGSKACLIPHWPRWCREPPTEADVGAWSPERFGGNGLACGVSVVVVDIDTLDATEAARLEALARSELGDTPLRRVGKPPKVSLYYRPAETIDTRKRQGLDLLGLGSQSVAFATHPGTGRPYAWGEHTPLDTPATDLPEVTAEQVGRFLDATGLPEPSGPGGGALAPVARDATTGLVTDGRNGWLLLCVLRAARNAPDGSPEVWATAAWEDFVATTDLRRPNPELSKSKALEMARYTRRRVGAGKVDLRPQNLRVVDELNREYAIAWAGGDCVVIREHFDPVHGRDTVSFAKPAAARMMLQPRSFLVGQGNKKRFVNPFDYWLASPERREYRHVVFEPGREVPRDYNLWRGWAVAPDPRGAEGCPRFLEHVVEVLSSGDEEHADWFLDWLAQAVREPARKPGTAVVWRSLEGTGKGITGEYLERIWGPHYLYLSDGGRLTGRFNDHLKHALLVFGDEVSFGGDRAGAGGLKSLITERTLAIEPKFQGVLQVRNHLRLLIATNEDWAIPAGLEARRFFMPKVSTDRISDSSYFAAIAAELEAGGAACLFHYLLSREPTRDLRQVPRTAELLDQKERSMAPTERFWFDRLRGGELCEDSGEVHGAWEREAIVVRKVGLYEEALGFWRRVGVRYAPSPEEFWPRVRELAEVPKNEPERKRTFSLRERDGSTRTVRRLGQRLMSLGECRAAFERRIRQPIEWPLVVEDPEETPI